MRTCVRAYVRKFKFANKIEAIHERSLVSVKVEPRSTCRLNSAVFVLPLFYLRALTCVAKNAPVKISLKFDSCGVRQFNVFFCDVGERLSPCQAAMHPFLAPDLPFCYLLPQHGDKLVGLWFVLLSLS